MTGWVGGLMVDEMNKLAPRELSREISNSEAIYYLIQGSLEIKTLR